MSTARPVRILLAHDHPVFRFGLRRLLESERGYHVVGEAGDGETTLQLTRRLKPDILVMDVAVPRLPALEVLRQIGKDSVPTRTLLLSDSMNAPQIAEYVQLGARGVMLENTATEFVIKGVRAIVAGEYWIGRDCFADVLQYTKRLLSGINGEPPSQPFGLTAREMEVVQAIVSGQCNKDIAEKLEITEATVKHHLTNIFDKLGVSNRLELALAALHHKLLPPKAA
jgi:DNA-binding NarL/FixJ family response regulator